MNGSPCGLIETNSSWYIWTCDQTGTLEFTLTPTNAAGRQGCGRAAGAPARKRLLAAKAPAPPRAKPNQTKRNKPQVSGRLRVGKLPQKNPGRNVSCWPTNATKQRLPRSSCQNESTDRGSRTTQKKKAEAPSGLSPDSTPEAPSANHSEN